MSEPTVEALELPYGTIVGDGATVHADGSDVNPHPDVSAFENVRVTFTPSDGNGRRVNTVIWTGVDGPTILHPQVETGRFVDGRLVLDVPTPPQPDGMRLMATVSDDMVPNSWGWKMEWTGWPSGKGPGPVIFPLAPGATVDIAEALAGYLPEVPAVDFANLLAAADEVLTARDQTVALRDEVQVISGLTGEDEAVALLVGTPTSNTRSAVLSVAAADQVDFVELVRANSPRYTTTTLTRVTVDRWRLRHHDGNKGLVNQLVKDTNDDFIKLDAFWVGHGTTEIDKHQAAPGDIEGTWNTTAASWYTAQVGATFTATIRGSRIDIRTLTEPRGGMWSIVVDDRPAVLLSGWSAAQAPVTAHTIATDLDPDADHTVIATFIGDDPDHAPSSSPSRGYLRSDATGTLIGYVSDAAPTTMVLADGSNKEMAFTSSGTWIPDHGTGSAFKISEPVFLIDGEPADLANIPVGQVVPITDRLELRQHFHGRVDGIDIAEFHTTHTITTDGHVDFAGRFVVLAAASFLGYPMMLPGATVTDTFVSSSLSRHVTTGDESRSYFTNDRDEYHSGAVLSSTNPDVIAAGTITAPRLSCRRAATTGKPVPGEDVFVWNRASKPKMYWQAMSGHALLPGDGYVWGCRFMVAEIAGIREMIPVN